MDKIYREVARKLEHVEAFPLIALQAIRELRGNLDEVESQAIRRARELGASYADIGEALQVSRQGAAYKVRTAENNKVRTAENNKVRTAENNNGHAVDSTDDSVIDVRHVQTEVSAESP